MFAQDAVKVILVMKMYKRHGFFTNMIAMVLALTMPLCCCIVNTASGSTDACSSIAVQEKQAPSCCSQQENGEEPEPCFGDCGCIIKGTIFVQDWTPPVDLFGVDTPAPFFIETQNHLTSRWATSFAHGPPKYFQHNLGFSGAPPIRGTLILEV
jgi:hypothetical protein